MADAPVCHIIPTTTVDDRNQNKGPLLPTIPQATDLQSALAAIAAMRTIIQQLTHQVPPRPSTSGGSNGSGGAGKTPNKTKVGRYTEQRAQRVTTDVTIKSKADPEMTVTFKRIDGLTFLDNVTGEQFYWQRG